MKFTNWLYGALLTGTCMGQPQALGAPEVDPVALPPDAVVRAAISENRTGEFVKARFASEKGDSIPYQIFIPKEPSPKRRYPLLVFLHGAGELGNDNSRQLEGFPRAFLRTENQRNHPCYIIAPQCPKSDAWSSFPEYPANARSSPAPTPAIRMTIELIERIIAECNVDKSRVYVTGLSLGGEGTFDIVSRRPDLFAAAVPICGIADVERVSSMKSVLFWVFHGERDDINPVKYSREIVQALKAVGAAPKYTEYKGEGHDVWTRAYAEPELIPWLFQQHKQSTQKDSPSARGGNRLRPHQSPWGRVSRPNRHAG